MPTTHSPPLALPYAAPAPLLQFGWMHFRYELLPEIYTLVNVEPLLQGRLDLNPSLSQQITAGCGSLTAADIAELKFGGVRRALEMGMCVCEEQGRKKKA